MLESTWNKTNNADLLVKYINHGMHVAELKQPKVSDRKIRLLLCALRLTYYPWENDGDMNARILAEQFADGLKTEDDLLLVYRKTSKQIISEFLLRPRVNSAMFEFVDNLHLASEELKKSSKVIHYEICNLLRSIIGNPFRPLNRLSQNGMTVEEVIRKKQTVYGCCRRHTDNTACDCLALAGELPVWYNDRVRNLAETAYQDRLASYELDSEVLYVLWDALEDAGITGDIATRVHAALTTNKKTYRGFWPVDWLTGRD